jgi:hypothetical protein
MRHLFTLALAGAVAVAALAADSENLVRNPSLEEAVGENGLPEGWFPFSKPEGAYQFKVVPGGRTGAKALLLEGAGEFAGVGAGRVPFAADKQYAARGWVKVEGEDALCTVKLDYFAENGDYLASTHYEGHLRAGGSGWRPIAVVARRSDAPTAAQVGIAVAIVGKGKAWFDDLEFVSRPAPPEGNLLRNGSMEDVAGEQVFGYRSFFAEGGKGTLTAGAADPKDGWYVLTAKGDSQWCVSAEARIAIDRTKTYTYRGWARARAGTAQIKFDYFKGEEWIGQSVSDDHTENAWKRLAVVSELGMFPEATHLTAAVVTAGGAYDADFDALTLVAK